eukprot:gene8574-biopygen6861
MRWLSSGEMVTEQGHKIWFSGKEKRHEEGVGFLLHKDTVRAVMECEPISSRMIRIRLSANPRNLTIIQIYAPTSTTKDEDVDAFYDELCSTLRQVPKKDITIIEGDWNAKIATDLFEDWQGTIGKFAYGTTNERGERLLEFCRMSNVTVANTLGEHNDSRRVTWVSPDDRTKNQIDYILIDRKCKTCVKPNKTRSFPGTDIGSDHNLVMMTVRLKLKLAKNQKSNRIKYNLELLKNEEKRTEYSVEIRNKFAPLLELENVQELTDMFTGITNATAMEVLGKRRVMKQPWMMVEILDACDERRKLKATKFKSVAKTKVYKRINAKVKREIRDAKENFFKEKCKQIQHAFERNNTKKVFDTIKELNRRIAVKTSAIEATDGTLLMDENKIQERWTEYVRQLYNYPIQTDEGILRELEAGGPGDITSEEPEILRSEIASAVAALKNGKSPGVDNILAEQIKDRALDLLHKLCNLIWRTGEWPQQWTQSLIIPLPKKGNLKKCSNYRTISLISHPSKVLLKIIAERMKPQIEAVLSEEQAGFRAGRSTVEQICNCRILYEKFRDNNREVHHNFVDFKKAFDRVWRKALWATMRKHNITPKLIQLCESLYENATNAVMCDNKMLQWFQTNVRVRQGCILSPSLFNLFLEQIMMNALEDFDGTVVVGGRKINNLRFKDDIDLVAGNRNELVDLTSRLDLSTRQFGMEISHKKSKILTTSRQTERNETEEKVMIDGNELEEVHQFKYLGAVMNEEATSSTEIKTRLAMVTSQMVKLNHIWKSREVGDKTKIQLMRALVTTVALYGCEAWTLSKQLEKKITAFEMRCFRRLLGIHWRDHRTNVSVIEEIETKIGDFERLLDTVKRRKLQWFGHVTRRPGTLAHTVMHGRVDGQRGRGRSRRSWMEDVKIWTNEPVSVCVRMAENRDNWRKTCQCPNGQ